MSGSVSSLLNEYDFQFAHKTWDVELENMWYVVI